MIFYAKIIKMELMISSSNYQIYLFSSMGLITNHFLSRMASKTVIIQYSLYLKITFARLLIYSLMRTHYLSGPAFTKLDVYYFHLSFIFLIIFILLVRFIVFALFAIKV